MNLPTDRPLAGIGFVVAGFMFLSVMDGVAKWVITGDISVVQLLAYRGWAVFTALLIALPFFGGLKTIRTTRLKAHATRAAIGCFAPLLFFEGLRYLSLADSVTLFFGSAFMMTAISAIFLGEKVGAHRWGAIAIGFVGVVIVTRPGDAFQSAAFFPIVASLCYSVFAVMGRWLGETEGTFSLVFYYNAGLTLIMTCALPFFWNPIGADLINGIGIISVLSLLGHLALHYAYRITPISVVAPYEYSSLVWAIAIDIYFFDTYPTLITMFGAGIIVACGLYIVYREAKLHRPTLPIENL
jgi:drug/metabolite transporter (DMT)-like permease